MKTYDQIRIYHPIDFGHKRITRSAPINAVWTPGHIMVTVGGVLTLSNAYTTLTHLTSPILILESDISTRNDGKTFSTDFGSDGITALEIKSPTLFTPHGVRALLNVAALFTGAAPQEGFVVIRSLTAPGKYEALSRANYNALVTQTFGALVIAAADLAHLRVGYIDGSVNADGFVPVAYT